MIRTIIIDDEPSSVNVLSLLLRKHCREVQIIGTTNSPTLGIDLIKEHQPDLVFLDIEMPGMSGIELLRSFEKPLFHFVFITAYNAYALEAFRLSAIDYLLKPVEAEDIIRVIEKIKNQSKISAEMLGYQLQSLQKLLLQEKDSSSQKIGIGMADKIVFVNTSDILYCEAQGTYTKVHLDNGEKILASKPLGEFETQLGPQFHRIHHSTLISLKHIKEFQKIDSGYVLMDNGVKLEVSQRKRKDFLEALEKFVV